MLLVPEALATIEKYKDNNSPYVLPFMKLDSDSDPKRFQKAIESKTVMINNSLKVIAKLCGIDKKLTSHVARHTFAYLADKSGLGSKRIQDLLLHSDLKTTERYINELNNSDTLDSAFDEFMKSVR